LLIHYSGPYPELPENHFAVFTIVIDPDGTITATPIFSGQTPETVDYHCSVGIPVDDPFWWGIFLEVEGTAKMETKKCKKD